ncbi:MT-A70 family methyltransferase [Bradyrhizobium sp. HKCCYLRH3099]|uniref:MT-A70 family methyltransferase n=1 Tax=unclassified Bradyrhizobium TaxID=2631580 RepID=UPI003EBBF271
MFLAPGHAPLKFHPMANLFPMLSEAELAALADDIKANGQVETVKLYQGMILDGRNRYMACGRANLGVRVELFTGDNRAALNYVCSKNLNRRHLAEYDRLRIAANMQKLKLGANQHSAGGHGSSPAPIGQGALLPELAPAAPTDAPLSQTERAELLKVSKRSLQRADIVYSETTAEEVKEAFEAGIIAVSVAADIAAKPMPEQKAILASLPRDDEGRLTAEAKAEIKKAHKEVRAEEQARKREKRAARERELGQRIATLPVIKAGLILSDFEWHFQVYSEATGMDRHAANHYLTAAECDTPEAIVERQRERMQVAADNCVHFMWVPACMVHIGLRVMELQGFAYVTQFVWVKPGMGTGYWVRDAHELLLIGVRGKVPAPSPGTQFRSVIEGPRGEHSEKPDAQYEICEAYFPTLPKIELNARRARPGWMSWGNEAPAAETVSSPAPCGEGSGVGVDTGSADEEQAA